MEFNALGGAGEDAIHKRLEKVQRSGVVLCLNGGLVVSGDPLGGVLEVRMPPELFSCVPFNSRMCLSVIVQKSSMVSEHPVMLFGNIVGQQDR